MKDKLSRFQKGIRHRPRKPEAETVICLPCVTCGTCVTCVMLSPDPEAAAPVAAAVSEDIEVLDQDTADIVAEAAEAVLTGDF
mmetsp:Transcript_3659/g.8506  ORF Transcript_3659/g.8506 Transcript_3659/m.8506 type:complete len:83 (-) Transcript_3659:1245-1493(-)